MSVSQTKMIWTNWISMSKKRMKLKSKSKNLGTRTTVDQVWNTNKWIFTSFKNINSIALLVPVDKSRNRLKSKESIGSCKSHNEIVFRRHTECQRLHVFVQQNYWSHHWLVKHFHIPIKRRKKNHSETRRRYYNRKCWILMFLKEVINFWVFTHKKMGTSHVYFIK